MKTKRILSIIIAIVMVFSLLPQTSVEVFAGVAGGGDGGGGGGDGGGTTGGGDGGGDSGPTITNIYIDNVLRALGILNFANNYIFVSLNQPEFSKELSTAKKSVVVPIPIDSGNVDSELVLKNYEVMNEKGIDFTVQSKSITYKIPTLALDTPAVLKALGAEDSSLVKINANIKKDIGIQTEADVNTAVDLIGAKVISPAIELNTTAVYNNKTYTIQRFNDYTNHSKEITEEQAKQITTAIVVEPDKTTRHIPTYLYQEGGKWYARANSLTNSTYVLISNKMDFSDAVGEWYQAIVNEMAGRRIINGYGNNIYAGQRDIIRAEFAAIVIRALGLPAVGVSTFSDVPQDAWYTNAVATAAEYGIVKGKGNNLFAPDAKITREEAMQMMFNASKITKYKTPEGVDNTGKFTDYGTESSWATPAVEFNLNGGLIQGYDGRINPLSNITRAETAAVVLRLLQKSNLVDVR